MGLMQIFKADGCCCGAADLRTGSLAISILGIVSGVLAIFLSPLAAIITIVLSSCSVYGIQANKPGFVFPNAIVNIVGFFVYIIGAILIPFGFFAIDSINEMAQQICAKSEIAPNNCPTGAVIVIYWEVVVIVGAVLSWWFGSVLYSYYKAAREEQQRPNHKASEQWT